MSNDYNSEDVLSKIKSRKSKQGKGTQLPTVPEKINPKSDFQIDRATQFTQRPYTTSDKISRTGDYDTDIDQTEISNLNKQNRQSQPQRGEFGFNSNFKLEQDPYADESSENLFDRHEPDILAQAKPESLNRPISSPTRPPRIQKPEEHTQVFQTPSKAEFASAAQEDDFDSSNLSDMSETKSDANSSTDLNFSFSQTADLSPDKKSMDAQQSLNSTELHVDIKPKKNLLRSLFHRLESMLPSTSNESEQAKATPQPPITQTAAPIPPATKPQPSVPTQTVVSPPTQPQVSSAPQQPDYQKFFSNLESDVNTGLEDDLLNNYTDNLNTNNVPPLFQSQEEPNGFQNQNNHPTFDSVPSFTENDNHFQINIPEEDSFVMSNKNAPMDDYSPTSNSSNMGPDTEFFNQKSQYRPDPSEKISSLTNAEIPIPESAEVDDEIEDYTSPKDRDAIINDMKGIKIGLLIRVVACFVVFCISLYLAIAARNIVIAGALLPLPEFMIPETNVRAYMIVSTLVVALAALICSNTVGGGILSLIKLRADTDALPALAVLGAMAQGVSYIVRPDFFKGDNLDSNLYLFFPVAVLVLVFNLFGKLLVILRIQNNFKLVSSEQSKYSVNFLTHRDIIREVSKGMSLEEYTIAYPEKAQLLTHFLDNSYSEDHAERMSRGLAPACLIAAILSGILSFAFNKNGAEAITTFTAVLCVCAPFTSTIASNLPLFRLSNKLIPEGAMITGYSSVDTFSKTEAVILSSCDVFHPEDVVLHGIKAFDQGKIDSVILDAASVVCSTRGMLTAVFSKIIGSNKTMLKPVENVTYEDNMGLSAWVDGKRVLIGNRELLMNHGVKVPSNDYEMRYVKDSKNIIYLSNSGELTAMFVLSYNPNSEMENQLNRVASNGMYLIIETSDPNITAEKIRDAYQFPIEQVKILPARVHQTYLDLTSQRDSASSKIAFVGNGEMILRTILDCMTIRSSISQAVLMQMIALVLGYGIITLFTLMGNLGAISVLHVIAYQLVWAVLIMLFPNMKRL